MLLASNLVDNTFLRQYELKIGSEMATIEYAQQERKIFLTKLNIPQAIASESFVEDFLSVPKVGNIYFSKVEERKRNFYKI